MTDVIGRMLFHHTTIKKGDFVRIVGKDDYKGYVGIVKKISEKDKITFYSIELQANGKLIKRLDTNIKKEDLVY